MKKRFLPGVAAVAGVAVLLLGGSAGAQESALSKRLEGAVHLDLRAAGFAAIHPTDLADGFALVDLLGGIFPDAIRTLSQLRDALGLYAFSRSEFADNGVDPDALALVSLGTADGVEWITKKKGAPRPAFVRHRFVMRTLDSDRFLRAATAILSGSSAGMASFAQGRLQGVVPKWAHEVKAVAKKQGVLLVARLRGGAVVAVRQAGEFALIDYADPWGPGTVDPKLDIGPLLQKMVAAPKQTLASAIELGTRKLLAEEQTSIVVVLEPGSWTPLFSRASCRKDWTGTDGALFGDAAVLLRLHPFQWRLEVAWSLSAAGKTRFAGAAADDGLLDAKAAAADGVAAASLLVGSLDTIRTAPRTGPFAGGLAQVQQSLDTCGPLAALSLAARFWPQLAALQIEQRAARLQTVSILPTLRNIAAVVRQIPPAKQSWEAVTAVFASLPSSAQEGLTALLSRQASGRAEKQSFGERLPTFFDLVPGTGFSEAGVERIAGDHGGLAMTPESAGLGWYYRMARKPAKFGPQSKVGVFYVNLARLLESRADAADHATRAAVRLAASQLGQVGGNMTLEGDLLRLDLNLGN